MKPSVPSHIFFAVLMMTAGSFNTVSNKISYQTCAPGLATCSPDPDCEQEQDTDTNHFFGKAWMLTCSMFMGETLCLFYYFGKEILYPSDDKPMKEKMIKLVKFFPLNSILALLDLASTALMSIGLLYVSSSVSQMFRGLIIIFTALWSRFLFKRHFDKFRLIGMGLVIIGLVIVGVSAIIVKKDSGTDSKIPLGIMFVSVGQLTASTEYIFEEKFLKEADISALMMVGCEGLSGMILSISVALPVVNAIHGSDCGKYENVADGLAMLRQNMQLLLLTLGFIFSDSFYNMGRLQTSKHLSALHTILCDTCRTITVWLVMVIVYYTTSHRYGESWGVHSYVQLTGFAFMICGTLLYYDAIPIDRIRSFFTRRSSSTLTAEQLAGSQGIENDNLSQSLKRPSTQTSGASMDASLLPKQPITSGSINNDDL